MVILSISEYAVQEVRRKEEAAARGALYIIVDLLITISEHHLLIKQSCFFLPFYNWSISKRNHTNFIFHCSWHCSWGEKLASIFPHHSSWHCEWNTDPSAEAAICCIHNLIGYVKFCSYSFICRSSVVFVSSVPLFLIVYILAFSPCCLIKYCCNVEIVDSWLVELVDFFFFIFHASSRNIET